VPKQVINAAASERFRLDRADASPAHPAPGGAKGL
jgi:hypothetical protein